MKHLLRIKTKGEYEPNQEMVLSGLTVALALLLRVGVVEQALPVVGPGHAAELDPLQPVLQCHGALHPQEVDLHPVRAAGAGAVCQVLAVLREGVT